MKLLSEFSGQIACEIRQETKPLPHNILLLFFKICISFACFKAFELCAVLNKFWSQQKMELQLVFGHNDGFYFFDT